MCCSWRRVVVMTADKAPQPEYIITEEQRQRICRTDVNLYALADEVAARPHPLAPASEPASEPTADNTIAALISENARLGSELKRMTEKADRLSGDHDAAIASKARDGYGKQIRDKISHLNVDDCFGEMNGELCLFYESNCFLCMYDAVIESLRQEAQQ
jgi:hypothetical protein